MRAQQIIGSFIAVAALVVGGPTASAGSEPPLTSGPAASATDGYPSDESFAAAVDTIAELRELGYERELLPADPADMETCPFGEPFEDATLEVWAIEPSNGAILCSWDDGERGISVGPIEAVESGLFEQAGEPTTLGDGELLAACFADADVPCGTLFTRGELIVFMLSTNPEDDTEAILVDHLAEIIDGVANLDLSVFDFPEN